MVRHAAQGAALAAAGRGRRAAVRVAARRPGVAVRVWPLQGLAVGLLAGIAAFAYDEPAAAVVDTLPRGLAWRTAARSLGVVLLLGWWLVVVALTRDAYFGHAIAIAWQGLAATVAVVATTAHLRRRGAAGPATLVGTVVVGACHVPRAGAALPGPAPDLPLPRGRPLVRQPCAVDRRFPWPPRSGSSPRCDVDPRSGVGEDRRSAVVVVRPAARPGPGVRRVLDLASALAEVERGERVDHDRRLLEVLHAERRLDRGGLRVRAGGRRGAARSSRGRCRSPCAPRSRRRRRTSPRRSRRWSGSRAPGSTARGSRPCGAGSCRPRSCGPRRPGAPAAAGGSCR